MSASSAAARIAHISPATQAQGPIMRGALLAGTGLALVPLVLVIYYLLYKGLGAWSGSLLHHRSQRELLRRPRRDPQRDLRHAGDRGPGLAHRHPGRDRRGAVSDRVRQGGLVRQRRALLRRRDDRRAFGRVRPVHLHRARDLPRGRLGVRRLEGLAGAGAADAADRHPLLRSRAHCWCRGACARRRWLWARPGGGSSSRVSARLPGRAWSPARFCRSPAAWARRRRCCSPSRWRRR